MKPYLNEVNISNQELALWWIDNIVKGLILILLLILVFNIGRAVLETRRNLNPRPLCAPASFEGKMVTNCIEK